MTGYSVRASSYEVFDYNLPVRMNAAEAALLTPGSQFVVNRSVLGGELPGFSLFAVASVDGDDVDFLVHNISEVPDSSAVPELATWAMMLLGFGLIGGAMRSGKRKFLCLKQQLYSLQPRWSSAGGYSGPRLPLSSLSRPAAYDPVSTSA